MSVAKTIEITAQSNKSFEDAIKAGVAKAASSVDNVESAWIKDQTVLVDDGKVETYRVRMSVTFKLK